MHRSCRYGINPQIVRSRSPVATLAKALDQGRTLVVLDNFEQLVPDGVSVVQSLLTECPDLCLLVTTRRLLRLDAEREMPLRPLPVPDEAATATDLLAHDCARLGPKTASVEYPNAPTAMP